MAGTHKTLSLRSALLLLLVAGAILNGYRSPDVVSSRDEEDASTSSTAAAASVKAKNPKGKSKPSNKPITPAKTLPAEYKICRVDPSPIQGQPPVQMSGKGLPIWYQCAGKPYDDYMYKVYGFVKQQDKQHKTKSKWGRRKFLVPKPLHVDAKAKKKHRKILILGNSHTRQMTASLLCQYRQDIDATRVLVPSTARKNVAQAYTLPSHHLTVYVIFNHPFVYSKTWKATLEIDILQHPLHDLDAIVLGPFNSYRESKGTSFLNTTLAYQAQFPHQGVDFERIKAPTYADFVKVYPGPLIWVSMFAHYNVPIHQQTLQMIGTLSITHNRTNLKQIDGRKYMAQLGECSSNVGDTVATCVTDRTTAVYKNGHRCTGDKGGPPDLVAWDVLEELHQVLAVSGK